MTLITSELVLEGGFRVCQTEKRVPRVTCTQKIWCLARLIERSGKINWDQTLESPRVIQRDLNCLLPTSTYSFSALRNSSRSSFWRSSDCWHELKYWGRPQPELSSTLQHATFSLLLPPSPLGSEATP